MESMQRALRQEREEASEAARVRAATGGYGSLDETERALLSAIGASPRAVCRAAG